MKNVAQQLLSDEAGFVVSSELVLIATILVIGITVGMTSVRDQVVQELGDWAISFGSVNQSYSYSAVTGHTSSVAGSIFNDLNDDCDSVSDVSEGEPACLSIQVAATPEG